MGAISGGTRDARFLLSYYGAHLSRHARLNPNFFSEAEQGRGKKPNNECGGESGMGVMSGRGILMASSLPSPHQKFIRKSFVGRAGNSSSSSASLSSFMRGFSERNPRTTDEDFTPSGLVGRRSRLRRIVVRGNTPHEQPGEIVPVTKPGHNEAIR